jgi:hypothetical protein
MSGPMHPLGQTTELSCQMLFGICSGTSNWQVVTVQMLRYRAI